MPAKKKSAWSLAAEAIQQSAKTQEPENGKTEEPQNAITELPDSGKAAGQEDPIFLAVVQNVELAELQSRKADEMQNIETVEPENVIIAKPISGKAAKKQSKKTAKRESVIADTEGDKPTEKITLYLTWQQLDKLDQMALEYKRRTRKRTDHNKLMRMMVDRFDLDDLL